MLHVFHAAPPFQDHQCVDGVLLDATAPRGVPVPAPLTDDAAELFDRLGRVPVGDLPPLPRGWAEDGDTPTADLARTPESLVRSLTTKLNAAGAIWGWARPTDVERVEQAVRDFLRVQT